MDGSPLGSNTRLRKCTNGMSVISVQASAAQEVTYTDPGKTVEVLANIENAGRNSPSVASATPSNRKEPA